VTEEFEIEEVHRWVRRITTLHFVPAALST